MDDGDERPVLTAVSTSARQLYLLLRCINFSDKAHVQITEEGIKFSVEEASVMEGSAFLDKSLFTTYIFHAPVEAGHSNQSDSDSDTQSNPGDTSTISTFQMSLPSLLETLLILGLTDSSNGKPPWTRDMVSSTAFNNVLGLNSMCLISYRGLGDPLSLVLTESSIRTTCNLNTYEPAFADEIPFDRQSLAFKTIMRGSWLFDAITELQATNPESLTMVARMVRERPWFAVSAKGPVGSARVEFNNDNTTTNSSAMGSRTQSIPDLNPVTGPSLAPKDSNTNVLETFQLRDPDSVLRLTYKFSMMQKAARAMSVATKVSIRADTQGVLSLQFMIEVGEGSGASSAKVSFVDFRFVPLLDDEDEGEEEYTVMDNARVSVGGDVESGDDDEEEMLID
ncbi:hypothetical protein M011DRAFT_411412 [Sporormia fimetaria CBS 119925]|uniref:Rad1-domain-containing protein n=1 Tax=Sporormia fimetaria CBS 119925 TaxID=1340428 RepID=A0A6A6UZS6_9PLEO|nr:hypothetical protein M011DRAFT_411412 [Sporormia fimetaria CBS 119925]